MKFISILLLIVVLNLHKLYSQSVIINEFLASNVRDFPEMQDFDDYTDWIEIHNPSSQPFTFYENFITDENGAPYKIYKNSPDEIWNTEVYKKLRKDLLNGKKPKMCVRCWREEATGIKSAREGFNESYKDHIEEAIASTKEDGSAPVKGVYVDLRLGNLCNLKCRMCGAINSSQIAKEESPKMHKYFNLLALVLALS